MTRNSRGTSVRVLRRSTTTWLDALFNILGHPPEDARVLDLYAGSGAIGLEALSRGAGRVLLVESDARAAAVIKANVKTVDLPGATVAVDRAERLLARPLGKE